MLRALLLVLAVAAALVGCGDETTTEEERADEPETVQEPEDVNLLITSPQDGTTVRGRSVVVRGTVAPGNATVEIDGVPVDVRPGGRFSARIRLEELGENSMSLVASASGFEATEEELTVERQRTAREVARIRERRRERREQELAQLRATAVTIPYNQLEKNPDRHTGEKVKYTGQIFQIQEDVGFTVILLAVTHEPLIDFWDDNIWVNYEGTINSAEDDIITVYGEVVGSKSYETQAGGETYVPEINAEIIEE
jgi:hypothetical protein